MSLYIKKQNKTRNQTTATTKQTNQSASRLQLWSQAVFIGEAACPQLTGRRARNAPNFLLTWTLHSGSLGSGKNCILFGKCFGVPQNLRHPGSLEQRENAWFGKWFPSFILWSFFCGNFGVYCSLLEGLQQKQKGLGFHLCGWVSWSLESLSLMVLVEIYRV